jgi:Reverse transcriptase (RNA-dependent DNA polymerase)
MICIGRLVWLPVDVLNIDIYSSMVKSISVKLLHVIAHKKDLKQLCHDVESAYVNAYTNKKVYTVAGPEFGTLEGSIVIIRKALYGLRSSSERWHAHFADTLCSMEFVPTRYDKDV